MARVGEPVLDDRRRWLTSLRLVVAGCGRWPSHCRGRRSRGSWGLAGQKLPRRARLGSHGRMRVRSRMHRLLLHSTHYRV